jgi:hypothetical protein
VGKRESMASMDVGSGRELVIVDAPVTTDRTQDGLTRIHRKTNNKLTGE